MRLKRILLSLTAFVLALSSALPAGAEAFTPDRQHFFLQEERSPGQCLVA